MTLLPSFKRCSINKSNLCSGVRLPSPTANTVLVWIALRWAATVRPRVICRLSFEKIAAVSGSDTGAAVTQGVKLFIAPETEVKSGSKSISGKIITKMTKGTAVKMTGKSVNNDGYT